MRFNSRAVPTDYGNYDLAALFSSWGRCFRCAAADRRLRGPNQPVSTPAMYPFHEQKERPSSSMPEVDHF